MHPAPQGDGRGPVGACVGIAVFVVKGAVLQRYDGMGGMLDSRHITGWQYPVAETLCAFMIRQNRKNYVDFIVGIKEGLSWEESLDQRYKAPRERLVRAYGESLGIKGLKE